MESNDSPEIPDRGETLDIPGLPSGVQTEMKYQDFLNMDFNITLESVYYPLMEPQQNGSLSDTDVEKQECRQKSTLCHLPVSGKEKDY